MTSQKLSVRSAQRRVSNPASPIVPMAEKTPNPSKIDEEVIPNISARDRGHPFLTPLRPRSHSISTASSVSSKISVGSRSGIFEAPLIQDSEPRSPITPFDTPQTIGDESEFFKGSNTRLSLSGPTSHEPRGSPGESRNVQDSSPSRSKRRGRPATGKEQELKIDQCPPSLDSRKTMQAPSVEAVLDSRSPPESIAENKSPLVDNLSKVEECQPAKITPLQLSNIEDMNVGIREVEHVPRKHLLEFRNVRKKKNRRAINNSIIEILGKAKTPSSAKPPRKGYIYVYTSLEHAPDHLKIGKTIKLPEERIHEWQKQCGLELSEVSLGREYMNPFPHFSTVESLLMAEFSNERQEHNCHGCRGKKHVEWYELEQEEALRAIRRWVTWITTHDPFDESSRLKPYWQWKLARESKVVDNADWDAWTHEPGNVFSRNHVEYLLETCDARQCLQAVIRVEAKTNWRFIGVAIIVILSLCLFRGIFDAVLFFAVVLVI